MPPLRFPRHLRPCHISRSAQQPRYLSQTAHAKHSTEGDDFTHSCASSSAHRIPDQDITERRQDTRLLREFVFKKTKDGRAVFGTNPARWPSALLQDKDNKEPVVEQSTGEEWQSQVVPGDKIQGLYDEELVEIKLQIRQLAEQVGILQRTLSEQSLSGRSDVRTIASSAIDALHLPELPPAGLNHTIPPEHQSENRTAGDHPTLDIKSIDQIREKKVPTPPKLLFDHALAEYRKSVFVLISVFGELEDMTPRLAAKIAVPLARHLHFITKNHMISKDRVIMNDTKMNKAFKRYKADKKWYPSAIYEHQREEKSQARNESIFRLYILGRAQKRFYRSFYALIWVGNTLETMRAHIVFTIKILLLRHMRLLTQTAMKERDRLTLQALGQYRGNVEYLQAKRDFVALPDIYELQIPFTPAGSGQVDSQIKMDREMKGDNGVNENFVKLEANDKNPKLETNDKQLEEEASERENDALQNHPLIMSNSNDSSTSDSARKRSLLQELFPETVSAPPTRASETKDEYPKLDLPVSARMVRKQLVDRPKTLKEQVVESFQNRGEQVTVLQLSHCSTKLVEADFRRFIPKGQHIDTWRREGEFSRIIPGRDPLSLERLPFYYILFKNPESALAYQRNVSRLHKLSALHQPSNIFSAIPPPKGFVEDGEDLYAATSTYNLVPTHHQLSLNTVMQPYSPVLRALLDRGGYSPIVPDTDEKGNRIWKVLMHIEGYEPTPSDLFKIFRRDAFVQGLAVLTLRNESSRSIHRLRDLANLKTVKKAPSSSLSPFDSPEDNVSVFEDAAIQSYIVSPDDDHTAKEINQTVMNRLYNRWIIEFENEDAAVRFARTWHRRVLPEIREGEGWKEREEERVCNVEVLW